MSKEPNLASPTSPLSCSPTKVRSRPKNPSRRSTPPLPHSTTGIRTTSYIDSVEIQRTSYFRSDFIRYMRMACGKVHGPETVQIPGVGSFVKLWLHQPNSKAIAYLSGRGCRITRVHVALDIFGGDLITPRSLQAYLANVFLPNSTVDAPIVWATDKEKQSNPTAYFRFRDPWRPGTSFAVYADRLSKAEGIPCCHFEARVNLVKYLSAYALGSPEDLLLLNHTNFWMHRLTLKEAPSALRLGTVWINAMVSGQLEGGRHFPFTDLAGRNGREYSRNRVGQVLRRSAQDRNGEICANDLLFMLRTKRPLGTTPLSPLFTAIDNSWLLPPAHNALWGLDSHIDQRVSDDQRPHTPLSLLSEGDIPY